MVIDKSEIGISGIAKLVAGEQSFFVRVEFWELLGHEASILAPGSTLSEEEGSQLLVAAQATEAEARGASLLGRAEQTRFLLRAKLLERGYPDRSITLALDRLEAEGFLSDRRYAEAWLRARIGKSLKGSRAEGPSSLQVSLRARSVPEKTSREAIASVLDEVTRATLLRKAIATLSIPTKKAAEAPGREALRHELYSLGWKGEEVREALES
ncbi:MAG: regulatory protein RecX [Spirochaetota bacterium]